MFNIYALAVLLTTCCEVIIDPKKPATTGRNFEEFHEQRVEMGVTCRKFVVILSVLSSCLDLSSLMTIDEEIKRAATSEGESLF